MSIVVVGLAHLLHDDHRLQICLYVRECHHLPLQSELEPECTGTLQPKFVDVVAHEGAELVLAYSAVVVRITQSEQFLVRHANAVVNADLAYLGEQLVRDVGLSLYLLTVYFAPCFLHFLSIHGQIFPVLQDDVVLLGRRITLCHLFGVNFGLNLQLIFGFAHLILY